MMNDNDLKVRPFKDCSRSGAGNEVTSCRLPATRHAGTQVIASRVSAADRERSEGEQRTNIDCGINEQPRFFG